MSSVCDCKPAAKCINNEKVSKSELEKHLASLGRKERHNYAIKHDIPVNPFSGRKIEWSPTTFNTVKPVDLFDDSLPSPNHSLMDDERRASITHQQSIVSCEHREISEERREISRVFFESYVGPPSPKVESKSFLTEMDQVHQVHERIEQHAKKHSVKVESKPETETKESSTQTEWCIDPDWTHSGSVPFLRLLPAAEDELFDASHIVYLPMYKKSHWRPLLATEILPKAYFTDGRGNLMCDQYRRVVEGDDGPSGMTPSDYRLIQRPLKLDDSPKITPTFGRERFIESPCGLSKFSPSLSPITPQTRPTQRSGSSTFRLNISPILANSPDLYGPVGGVGRIRKNSGTLAPFSGQLSFCLDDEDDEENDVGVEYLDKKGRKEESNFNHMKVKKPVVNSTMRSISQMDENSTNPDQGYLTMSTRMSENMDGTDMSDAALASTPSKNRFFQVLLSTNSEQME